MAFAPCRRESHAFEMADGTGGMSPDQCVGGWAVMKGGVWVDEPNVVVESLLRCSDGAAAHPTADKCTVSGRSLPWMPLQNCLCLHPWFISSMATQGETATNLTGVQCQKKPGKLLPFQGTRKTPAQDKAEFRREKKPRKGESSSGKKAAQKKAADRTAAEGTENQQDCCAVPPDVEIEMDFFTLGSWCCVMFSMMIMVRCGCCGDLPPSERHYLQPNG